MSANVGQSCDGSVEGYSTRRSTASLEEETGRLHPSGRSKRDGVIYICTRNARALGVHGVEWNEGVLRMRSGCDWLIWVVLELTAGWDRGRHG